MWPFSPIFCVYGPIFDLDFLGILILVDKKDKNFQQQKNNF